MIIREIETNVHDIAPLTFTKTDIDCVANSCAYTEVTCDVDFAELFVLKEILPDKNIAIHTIYKSVGIFESEFFDRISPVGDECKAELDKLIRHVYTKGVAAGEPLVLGMCRVEATFVFTGCNHHYIVPNLERHYDRQQIGNVIAKNMRELIRKFSIAEYGVSYNTIPIHEKYEVAPDKSISISTKARSVLYDGTSSESMRHFKKPTQPDIQIMKKTIEDIVRWNDSNEEGLIHYDTLPSFEKCMETLDSNLTVTKFLDKISKIVSEEDYELRTKCTPVSIEIDCVVRKG